MKHEDFLTFRRQQVEDEDVLDFAETNLEYYFKETFPEIKGDVNITEATHSNIIKGWLDIFKLDPIHTRQLALTHGSENSIESLMKNFNDKSWYMPQCLISNLNESANRIISSKIAYYDNLTFSNIFRNIPTGTEIIFCSSPLIPYGRKLQTAEYYTLKQWLKEDSNRRIIFDCSSTFTFEETDEIFKIFQDTQQAYLIFSFSHHWVIPDNIGLIFMPSQDILSIQNTFSDFIETDVLEHAYRALKYYPNRPQQIREAILNNINNTTCMITDFGFIFDVKNPSFLFYSSKSAEYWKEQGYLVIDATEFGAKSGSIISVLN